MPPSFAYLALLALLAAPAFAQDQPGLHRAFIASDGQTALRFDFTGAPDLQPWGEAQVAPALQQWYPKIAALLASPGFHPATVITISFQEKLDAVAVTSDNHITANASYFRMHPKDVNALVHEATHVVQAYHNNGAPSWLVEGLDDYIRYYIVEPGTHAADIPPRRATAVHYDDSYRTTANFLHWVVTQTDPSAIVELNAALREGTYSDKLWKKLTGESLPQLGDEWKQSLQATK
jgi:hypothetical protein